MAWLNRTLLVLLLFFVSTQSAFSQDGMEEFFYESGKIKVVVVVAFVVMAGLLIYAWSLGRRLKKLDDKK
jgi:amino acid permease